MLLCVLWFAAKNPPMNVLLKPFVDELTRLHEEGFESTTLFTEEEIRIKVRPAIQNISKFNGKYGCSYCLHKRKNVPVGRGTARIYCGDVRCPRTIAQHDADAEEAVVNGKLLNERIFCCIAH